jgi:hypothetical protein
MIGDLPELDTFFNEDPRKKNKSDINKSDSNEDVFKLKEIYIFISKEKDKWIPAEFLDIAVAGIGLHVRLPISIELSAGELNNVFVKFVKKINDIEEIIKEAPVLVRWQDHDEITGNLKLGLHLHGDLKNDKVLIDILKELKS